MQDRAATDGITICPACGSANGAPIGKPATAFDSVVGGKTFRQPSYSIQFCEDCGLYFKSHILALEELGEYYACLECETYEYDGNFPTDRILHRMLDSLPNECKVLDFGCNTGRILKTKTSRLSCFGVEVNEAAAAIARQRGIRIVAEVQVATGEICDFDAIILTDVYEHMLRPVELVEMLVKALKPGGWIAIVTGNADAIRNREWIGEFWYFRTPAHLLMASERHIHWLANRLGLRIDSLRRCSHYDTPLKERLKQYLQTLAYYQFRRAPQGNVAKFLRVIPFLNRAERWSSAPALTCTTDHVVAIFRKNPECKSN